MGAATRARSVVVGMLLVSVMTSASNATTLEEAQAEAAASGRLLLVDVSAEWCGPCRRFAAEHESSRKLQAALERYVFLVVDDKTPAGERTMARLRVRSWPTFLLLTPQGEEIERWTGFGDVKGFVRQLAAAAADPTTLEAKRARLETQPDGKLAFRIATTLALRSEYADAVRYYDRASELDASLSRQVASDRYFAISSAVYAEALSYEDLMDAGERYVAAFPGGVQGRRVARNVAGGLASAIPDGFDRARIKPAIERGLRTYTGKLSEEDEAQRDRLTAALSPPRTVDERLADLDAKPTINGTFALLSDLQAAGRHADAARITRRAVDLEPRAAPQISVYALSVAAEGAREGQVSVGDLVAAAQRAVEAGGGKDETKLAAIGEVARALARGQDPELLRAQVEEGLALTAGDADAHASVRAELLALRAAVIEKDGAKALALEMESLGEGWEEEPGQILDLADFLLDCGIELPEAERLARETLAATEDRGVRNRSSLSLARALRQQGRADEAVAVLEAASKASPHDVQLARALGAE